MSIPTELLDSKDFTLSNAVMARFVYKFSYLISAEVLFTASTLLMICFFIFTIVFHIAIINENTISTTTFFLGLLSVESTFNEDAVFLRKILLIVTMELFVFSLFKDKLYTCKGFVNVSF